MTIVIVNFIAMKKVLSRCFEARLISLITMLVSFVISMLCAAQMPIWRHVFVSISMASSSLILYPTLYDKGPKNRICQIFLLIMVPPLLVWCPSLWGVVALSIFVLLCYILSDIVRSCKSMTEALDTSALCKSIVQTSKSVGLAIYSLIVVLAVILEPYTYLFIALNLTLVIFYLYVFYRSRYGRISLGGCRQESRLMDAIEESNDSLVMACSDNTLKRVYDSLLDYMEKEKPFLNPSLKMEDLYPAVCTNRTYLSAAINKFSGLGFPKFVHKYRVDYAIKLMHKNPKLTIVELAKKSGYNSDTNLGNAFAMFHLPTPGAYKRNIIAQQALQSPSSSEE